jgi:predicted dehydrogenase
MKKNEEQKPDLNRRQFLAGGSFASLLTAFGAVEIKAQDQPEGTKYDANASPPVGCGLIGCGTRGREILENLAQLPNAPVKGICDHYGAYLRRGAKIAKTAEKYEKYQDLLANKEVEAVIVATPTHQHRQIVIDCLKAGKHVYVESPMAHTIEDARAIAQAARKHNKVNFQVGLPYRSDPQRHFLNKFIKTGVMGRNAMGRAQWHKKQSWKRFSPNNDRQKEINWRTDKSVSLGLVGEVGLNQLDAANWTYRKNPVAVTGMGSFIQWNKDKQDVPNNVQVILEYPDGVNLIFHSSLANSFDSDYEIYYGSDSALMVRDDKAWMFKEADSPLLGWEVYARKDKFQEEEGVALVMNATKLKAQGTDGAENAQVFKETPLFYALKAFVSNSYAHQSAAEDFAALFGDDAEALSDYLVETNEKKQPYADYQIGYEAAVTAIKANEAITTGKRIEFKKEWFELG